MQTTLEDAENHTVRLTVEVAPEEVRKDLDRAYRKVAGQVRIPGFRKGKAPRQVIDAMVGRETVVEEFVHDSVPTYYVRAMGEHDLVPIAEPEIDLGAVEEDKPLVFTATVEVRPRIELEPSQYEGLHIEAPSAEPTETEIDEYIGHLRDRFAELETVTRPAAKGDYVLADIRGHVHDEEIAEATQVGYLAEVGSPDLLPELSAELQGARAGDILKFNATMPGSAGEHADQEVAFQVLVRDVKTKKLPAADDEFAKTASEFDTLQELRDDIREKLREVKQVEVQAAIRDRALTELLKNVDVDLPERLVDAETEQHVGSIARRAERAGVSLEQALEAQGWDELKFRSDARAHAVRDLEAELVLEAVARREHLSAEPDEIDAEIAKLARTTGRDPKEVRRILDRSGEIASVAGDIIRTKALDLLVARADVVPKDVANEERPNERGDQGDGSDA